MLNINTLERTVDTAVWSQPSKLPPTYLIRKKIEIEMPPEISSVKFSCFE